MSRRDANKDTYEEIELFGMKMLLTMARIDRTSVPEGLHLYELRHSDEDWCDPVQIGKGVLVNFYGTVLSREPVELNADGFLDLDADAIGYLDSGTVELKDYLAQKPTMQLRAQPLTDADFQMCFSDKTLDKTMGVIGHLRGDFGSGREFFHSCFDHRRELNTEPFKSEFNKVVDSLHAGPLHSFETMLTFCRANPQARIPSTGSSTPEYLLKLSTGRFDYYTRIIPRKGEYNFYIYCTDNSAREIQLPETCLSTLPSTGQLIVIKRGERGYYPSDWSTDDAAENRNIADSHNGKRGITKAQEEAMLAGSMHGWDVPAAKPQVQEQIQKKREELER